MEEKNMTALVCCFARAYHNKNSNIKIYEDNLAEKILSKEEYDNNVRFWSSPLECSSHFDYKTKGHRHTFRFPKNSVPALQMPPEDNTVPGHWHCNPKKQDPVSFAATHP